MIASLITIYAFGVLGTLQLLASAIKLDPSLMPGGGRAAVLVIAVGWPIIAALMVVGVVLLGVSNL